MIDTNKHHVNRWFYARKSMARPGATAENQQNLLKIERLYGIIIISFIHSKEARLT